MSSMSWRIVCTWAVLMFAACQPQTPPAITGDTDTSTTEQLYQAGRAAYAAGAYNEAAETFARVVQLDPNHFKALVNWGAALSRDGKPVEAILKFQQALALDPQNRHNAEVYHNWGVALERLGKHQEAVEKFDQAVALNATLLTPELQRYLRRHRDVPSDGRVNESPAPPLPSQ